MRFYEQPVLGCFWKTVTKTCSNNVVSSNCVMLSWPWYTLIIIRRWILDRLRRMLWIYCFEMFRNVLTVRSQDGHFCRYGQTRLTWINDYQPQLRYGLARCRRKKGANGARLKFWDPPDSWVAPKLRKFTGIVELGIAGNRWEINSGCKLEAILPKDLLVGWRLLLTLAYLTEQEQWPYQDLSSTTCFVQSMAWTSETDNCVLVLYIAVPRSCW